MNKQRRQRIAKALDLLAQAHELVDTVLSEESEAYENMPEGLQQSERGAQMEAAVDALNEASNSLDEAVAQLEGIE
jgi:hypothetical protein